MTDGTTELVELAKLLRLGLRTTREIARIRTKDYECLMDIAERAEIMAADMDRITGFNTAEIAH